MPTEPPLSMRSQDFGLELVKLLLQVVWADAEVSEKEIVALRGLAGKIGLHSEHLDELHTYLSGEAPLPAPNLAVLKPRKVEVMRHVKALFESDIEVGEEEEEVLAQISLLLGA